jgi:hypothetical protein
VEALPDAVGEGALVVELGAIDFLGGKGAEGVEYELERLVFFGGEGWEWED